MSAPYGSSWSAADSAYARVVAGYRKPASGALMPSTFSHTFPARTPALPVCVRGTALLVPSVSGSSRRDRLH